MSKDDSAVQRLISADILKSSEEEWRFYVKRRLDAMDKGFGKRTADLMKEVRQIWEELRKR